jgi:hypothetical protein
MVVEPRLPVGAAQRLTAERRRVWAAGTLCAVQTCARGGRARMPGVGARP